MFRILVIFISLLAFPALGKDIKLCDDLIVVGDSRLQFSKTEKRLICGDSDNNPWSDPADNQRKLFLTSFLQSRGYFEPKFIQNDKTLTVETGKKTRVKTLTSTDTSGDINFTRFWVPWHITLTPSLLNDYEDLVHGRLEAAGYPCPAVTVTANAPNGSMVIEAEPGPRLNVIKIEETKDIGLKPHTLRRYFPIEEGDQFNGDLVHIANERIKTADIVGGSYMVSTCDAGGATIHHRTAAGPPRRMTIGLGVNTETYVIAKANYHSARLDENASNFDAIISANYFDQHIESQFEWYFLNSPSSLHFKPSLTFARINEASSEQRSTLASWHLGAYHDIGPEYVRGYVGPNLNLIRTMRGIGPAYARILELETNARLMSHQYEFYQTSPRSGHLLDLRYTTASEHTDSTVSVQTYSAKGEILFNFSNLEPPLLVFGFRGRVAGTEAAPDADLPDQYLYYLGGSDDIRGFRRRTIPSSPQGARSLMSGGTELRLTSVIPYNIQPFVFLDGGKLGQKPFVYDPTIYYSPGFGVRWQSPFGSLRGSVARGLIRTPDEAALEAFEPHWIGFVSFGEEF